VSKLRVAAVTNPGSRGHARLRPGALAKLREETHVVAELETRGRDDDRARIAELVAAADPDVLVAAGGDGTAGVAFGALLEAKLAERTALAFLPLGTGNNAARSFGLRSLFDGASALTLALRAIVSGPRRVIDAGLVDGRPFLGAFAIGMDADVLRLRNRLQRRLESAGFDGGYSLYLGSVAASLLRRHGAPARVSVEGALEAGPVYGLAAINTPVYAGPIRFDGANDCADGRLDVLLVTSAWRYVAEYASAWPRYLRILHGRSAAPSPRLRRARTLHVDLERPVAAQADGEELPASASFRVGVLPRALRVCVPH